MGRADSKLRDRLLLVVGARRSGTNWLARILAAHPAVVAMPSETYLFSHAVEPLTQRIQHADPASPSTGQTFVDRERFLDAVRDLLDAILADNLERLGADARYLVERTPWHSSHLPLVASVYPDARVVHIVRDGRAVARSLVSMDWGPDTVEAAAAEWRDSVEGGREGATAFGDRYREVSYEGLLAAPRERAAELFAWLGLELDDAIWEHVLAEAESEFNVDPGSPGLGTDKWRDELSAHDLRTVERVAGDQLEAYGYQLVTGTHRAARRPTRRRLADPRPALRRTRAAGKGRASRRQLHVNLDVAERFVGLVERGDRAAARALIAPRAPVRIVDGEGSYEGRGEEAAGRLLDALSRHRELGQRELTGGLEVSPAAFTHVGTYELGDGSRFARTLVTHVSGGRIVRVGLYRYRLYM